MSTIAMPDITWQELDAFEGANEGVEALRIALMQADTPEKLARIFSDFLRFNALAAAGVAGFTAQVSYRQDAFGNPDEPVDALSDCSYDVAQFFYRASLDEYGHGAVLSSPHRRMAIQTMKAVCKFFGFSAAKQNELFRSNAATVTAVHALSSGYGLGRLLNELSLFEAAGHHAASEKKAGDEYAAFYKHLMEEHPQLLAALQTIDPEISDISNDMWMRIHGTVDGNHGVEEDHAAEALKGVNMMVKTYRGSEPKATVRQLILDGYRSFAELQAEFYRNIGQR